MIDTLIDLHPYGPRGWSWTMHTPGRATTWRTNETGHGLWQHLPTGHLEPDGRPELQWQRRVADHGFSLPADRAAALARIRRILNTPPPPATATSAATVAPEALR
jgi:hypothetical protein